MHTMMGNFFAKVLIFAASLLSAASCDFFRTGPASPTKSGKPYSEVCLIYTIGYNNLKSSIDGNFKTIYASSIPMKQSSKVLLLFEHQSVSYSDYSTPTSPHLIRLTTDWNQNVFRDTLLTLPAGTFATDGNVIENVFDLVKETFDAESYGALFSSHGTGWLPERYYDSADESYITWKNSGKRTSFGCEGRIEGGKTVSHEIEITEFAKSIPYKLDYIIFDACLMGGVEVAYELRDCADLVAFSQTEVLGTGFNYNTLVSRLLGSEEPDVEGVCYDYYHEYADQGSSATVSLVATGRMGELESVCARLFEKYRAEIAALKGSSVQKYVRKTPGWLYDLRDIIAHAGASEAELSELDSALGKCILYKAATKTFLELKINAHCGLSMFLPSDGTDTLKEFYKTLAWNEATGLVK